jgi:hypothetical protein
VILTQKSQFFETLGWYQPSDFSPKKSIFKNWEGINPLILAQKSQFFETRGWYQPSVFNPEKLIF